MFSLQCNIDKTDRINRIVIGVLIVLAVLFSMSKFFFILLGIALIVEGIIGWCTIPYIITKLKTLKIGS